MLEKVICALMTWKRGISILTGKPEGSCMWMKCFNFWKWVLEMANKSTMGITFEKGLDCDNIGWFEIVSLVLGVRGDTPRTAIETP